MKDEAFSRRDFCAGACRAASVAALGGTLGTLLQSCGGGGGSTNGPSGVPTIPVVSASSGAGALTVAIDSTSPLFPVGGAALVQSASGSFLVSRTGPESFTALTAVCTHERCTITGLSGSTYVCPCHGSQFDQGGRVLSGPASVALRQFPTSFSNNVLTISA